MTSEITRVDRMSISQAASQLGVSRSTVADRIARGELQEFRSSLDRRTRFVSRAQVDALRKRAAAELEQPAAA